MSASVSRIRHASRRLLLTTLVAVTIALAAVVATGAAQPVTSGATVQAKQGSAATMIGVDAWFNDRASKEGPRSGGLDAWFNDPAVTTTGVSKFDAWYQDPAAPVGKPASFDAWFNDR
jgi:hypothetical protein